MKLHALIFSHIAFAPFCAMAQETYHGNEQTTTEGCTSEVAEGFSANAEVQVSFSNSKTPLWLNANKYGISSLNTQNGYLRHLTTYDRRFDDGRYEVTAAADIVYPISYKTQTFGGHHTTGVTVQQAYVEGRYKLGSLTIGAKQQHMELMNDELSSGAQTLGINARPIPQLRIGLNDYWNIPGLNSWLAFKGHLAYGMMTDGSWEEDFAKGSPNKYNKNTRYHQKAGYLRIGKEERFPLTLTLGLEMGAQFGGKLCNFDGIGYDGVYREKISINLDSNLKSYWNAFTGMGTDVSEQQIVYQNAEGNQVGSLLMRLDYKQKDWQAGLYMDHFFEDQSGMFFLDYDGYGSGEEWNEKKDRRFFVYDLKDFILGADIHLSRFRYVSDAVIEYMNTRYQSGPIYHDHTPSISDHVCGNDNYYNHLTLPGWQHAGQVMGNPLYLSPIYNIDGMIGTHCNRFRAWHFAFAGSPLDGLHYRVKLSWQRGWGTYTNPYLHPMENTSMLVEASYRFSPQGNLRNIGIRASYGADWGKLRGNNSGCQFTISYNIK